VTFRAPDLIEPLVGWRAWHVRDTEAGWRLYSIHYAELWTAGEAMDATCRRSRYAYRANENTHARHGAPARGCLCGVYAGKVLAQARQYFVADHLTCERVPPSPDYIHRVIGEVSLWGRVVECSQGYRASIAYPARLWVPTRRPDGQALDVEAVALDLLDYGVPVDLIDAGSRVEIMREIAQQTD
jgi:hypothetical protein